MRLCNIYQGITPFDGERGCDILLTTQRVTSAYVR
jgi:hypothetical protein